MKTENITEYEAAHLVGMSPQLLRWLTGHAPRPDSPAKLKLSKTVKDTLFFDKAELLNFNTWLSQPWPNRKDGTRATIPAGIRDEIRIEANSECAICNKNGDKCEAAHITSFAKTHNHHPSNLIWLCSNHHTAFDKGLFAAKPEDQEFVKSLKVVLHTYKRSLWGAQHELSVKVFQTLSNLAQVNATYEAASTTEHKAVAAQYAMKVLSDLHQLAPVSKADPNYEAYQKVSPDIMALQTAFQGPTSEDVPKILKQAGRIREKYSEALGYAKCPLCNGRGQFRGDDCPACDSLGEMPSTIAEHFDTSQYDLVPCPLCRGKRTYQGDDCPECAGEGKCLKIFADQFDKSEYEIVICPACDGTKRIHGEECPECQGRGKLESRFADLVDPQQYDLVSCPGCNGKRRFQGEECPICNAEGQMQRQFADLVDLAQYSSVECPVCEGSRKLDAEYCPACGGEGELSRWREEQVNMSDYEMVECPECDGTRYIEGEHCAACDGEGEMRRWRRDRMQEF